MSVSIKIYSLIIMENLFCQYRLFRQYVIYNKTFFSTLTKHDCRDYTGKIWNCIIIWRNVYKSYKIFIANVYLIKD